MILTTWTKRISMVAVAAATLGTACGSDKKDQPGTPDAKDGTPDSPPGTPDAKDGTPDAPTGACTQVLDMSFQIDDTDTAGDIAKLAGVKSVRGLSISGTNVKTLAGLECLETITQTFFISGTKSLVNLDALTHIHDIQGGVVIQGTSGLKSIAALENLAKLGGGQIDNNKDLAQCAVDRFENAMIAKGTSKNSFFPPPGQPGGNAGTDPCN